MNIVVSERMMKSLSNLVSVEMIRVVTECSKLYNFDKDEAIGKLGLENLKMSIKKEKKEKYIKTKASFPMPFNGNMKDECCHALRQNHGLYTQCQFGRKGENKYCNPCQQLADKSLDGIPEYGTIEQRMVMDIFDYVDPKGRKPISYTKVMSKYKLTREQVLEEAEKLNITINEGHFEVPVNTEVSKRGRPASLKKESRKEPKGSKGRPKKAKKVLEIEGEEDDLFASLVADVNEEENLVSTSEKVLEEEEVEEEVEVEVVKVDTKALEKKQKEEQRLKDKAEKEAKLVAEKEAKLAAEKAEKEAKLAAKEQEKKQKEEQRLKEKAEKEAKLAAEKAEKLAAKEQGKKKKSVEVEVEEEDEPDVVKKIEFEGKKYLKSKKTGIIYDYQEYVKNGEQNVVGKWNDSKNKIDFTETSEESEEEYEE